MGLISGIHRAYCGKVSVLGTAPQEVSGKIALLPQDPQTLFVKNTVIEDLLSVLDDAPRDRRKALALEKARLCELMELLERHPYDLSGGEQQRAALCKVLLREPEVLLLDEPTKGLDAEFKRVFARIIRRLCARGVCVIMVSHDAEFCASYASRCAMFFDGAIVAEGTPREFFSSGSFYTTSASRMARGLLPGAITPEDVIAACGGEVPPEPDLPADGDDAAEIQAQEEAREQAKTYLLPSQTAPLPLWRKLLGALGGLGALICLWRILSISDLSELLSQGGLTSLAGDTFRLYLAMPVCLLVLAVSFSRAAPQPAHSSLGGRPLSGRTKLASVLSLLLVPLTIFIGIVYFGKKSYGVVSILVLLECMAPFALIFEGRKPKARELVLIAALCALAVAGRAALFMLPGFKPVAALVILSGVAFGGETGFLVGAMSMLTSNVLFGQGPWNAVSDVRDGADRLSGRRELSEGSASRRARAACDFRRGQRRSGLRRHHEPGICDFIPAESEPFRSEGVLSDRFSLRSGPRGSDSAVSLVRRGADAGEARARQTQIWADRSRVKARFFVFSHKIYVHI